MFLSLSHLWRSACSLIIKICGVWGIDRQRQVIQFSKIKVNRSSGYDWKLISFLCIPKHPALHSSLVVICKACVLKSCFSLACQDLFFQTEGFKSLSPSSRFIFLSLVCSPVTCSPCFLPGSGFVMCSGKENPDSDADLDVDGDDTLEYGKPQYHFLVV